MPMTKESSASGNDAVNVGDIIDGRYQILAKIGSGETGDVYLANHQLMNLKVAVKVLRLEFVLQPAQQRRFEREATILAGLSHPNLVAIHDSGVLGTGQRYLVMSFVEGKSLKELIERREWLPLECLMRMFIRVCSGLSHAHKNGVIHRDLKPSNIMISRTADGKESVQIIDFGIARILAGEDKGAALTVLTQTGEHFFSPKYMSPEQCLGREIDMRSDIYSLGCVMYEALTGSPPFDDEQFLKLISKQVKDAPPPMRILSNRARLSLKLEEIVLRAMAKDPDSRYQKIDDLKEALESLNNCADKAASRLPVAAVALAGVSLLAVAAPLVFLTSDAGTIFACKAALLAESNLFPSLEQRIATLNVIVDRSIKRRDYREAVQAQMQLLNATESRFGADSLASARASKKLSEICRLSNDRDGVKKYSKRSVVSFYNYYLRNQKSIDLFEGNLICQEILDAYKKKDILPLAEGEPNYLTIVLQRGEYIAGTHGRTREAIQLFAQLVDLVEHEPKQMFLITFGLRGLGSAYKQEGRNKEAVSCYQRAISAAERNHGPQTGPRLDMLINGAESLKRIGERRKESDWLKQALSVPELLLPAERKDFVLINVYLSLAESLQAQGRVTESEDYYRRACQRCKQADITAAEKEVCGRIRANGWRRIQAED
jgi:serine/threonine protein kinase